MILLSSMGISVPERQNNGQYPDVIENEWYVNYILEAVERGILDAPSYGLLYPHRPVTRAEFLKMMSVTYGLPQNMPFAYQDITKGDWYESYAGIAYRYKLFIRPDTKKLYPNVLTIHYEASHAVQAVVNQHPNLRKTPLAALQQSLKIIAPKHFVGPILVDQIVKTTTTPPQRMKFITAKMVKQAMMRMLQKNTDVGTKTKKQLFERVNTERLKHGVRPLTTNAILTAASERHAKDMWDRRYFSHITPEGRTYVDRIRTSGYLNATRDNCKCTNQKVCQCIPMFALGENIAQGQLTVESVITDWMNSEPHRKNILNPEFSEIGIGLFGTIWVKTFGHVEFYEILYQ